MRIPVTIIPSEEEKVPVTVNGVVVKNGVARPVAKIAVPNAEEVQRFSVKAE